MSKMAISLGQSILAIDDGGNFAARMDGGRIAADYIYNGHGRVIIGRTSPMRMIVHRIIP